MTRRPILSVICSSAPDASFSNPAIIGMSFSFLFVCPIFLFVCPIFQSRRYSVNRPGNLGTVQGGREDDLTRITLSSPLPGEPPAPAYLLVVRQRPCGAAAARRSNQDR